MRHILSATLLMSGTILGLGNSAFSQSLEEDLRDLLKTHPAIEAARHGLDATEAVLDATGSNLLPTVSFYGDLGEERTDSKVRRDSSLGDANWSRDKYTITLRQNLFNGFSDTENIAAEEATVQAWESELAEVTAEEMLRGILAYIDILKYSEIVRLSREREETIAEQMQLENERVERGSGIAVDVLEAKSRLRSAKEKTVAHIVDLEQAEATYERAFGRSANIFEMKDVQAPFELLPSSEEEALSMAIDLRHSIKVEEFAAERWRHLTEAEKGGYYPSIDLVGSHDYEDDVGGTAGATRTSSIMMQLNWELFSGLETDARVREASYNASYYSGLALDERRKAEEDVLQSWSELQRSQERHDLLLSAVDIAEEVFASRQKLRDAGKETTINLLDAESQVYESRIKLIEMDYVSRAAVFKVLEATGLLQPENLAL
ncbi:TolC family protein [Curvivirga sp.]|uniref:TolC family protein n=1 Tax=Curvivirga sp. TaxID=2856848 RepID=UPI003B5A3803